ncbi:hypothetical protein [Nocardia otitidiscaviarum]|uniref:hypothetical protein n=1 Tax=Nocardia otitidiscaviarum TaxID=1823 RepID=UPI002454008B|nr:hypothetical protein [Nocardia otitidiscaviarum]
MASGRLVQGGSVPQLVAGRVRLEKTCARIVVDLPATGFVGIAELSGGMIGDTSESSDAGSYCVAGIVEDTRAICWNICPNRSERNIGFFPVVAVRSGVAARAGVRRMPRM